MTMKQRQAIRQRKERNQKLWWYFTDTLTLLGLIGTGYAMLLIGYAIQG